MLEFRHYLNGFMLTGAVLLVLAAVGLARGPVFLTEPGMPVNQSAALIYLGASVVMFVNGWLSIRVAASAHAEAVAAPAPAVASEQEPAAEESTPKGSE